MSSSGSISGEHKGVHLQYSVEHKLHGNEAHKDEFLVLQNRLFTPFLLKKVPPVPLELERPIYPDYPRYSRPIEWIFFTWLVPILKRGYKRTLVPADLFRLNEDVKVEPLAARFQNNFDTLLVQFKDKHVAQKIALRGETSDTSSCLREQDSFDFKPGPLLGIWATFKTFRNDYMTALVFMAAALAVQTTEPLLSKRLINYVTLKTFGRDISAGQGVGLAIGVGAMNCVTCIFINHAFFLSSFTGARMRGILTKLILDKSFRLSARSGRMYNPSKITSLMSTDVSRIDLGLAFSLWALCFPIPVFVAIGILVYNIHAPALVGVGIMVFYLLFASMLSSLLFKFRALTLKLTDARVLLVKEVLNNLRVIKLYSWEEPYFKMISNIRNMEMLNLLKMEVVRSVIISVASSLSSVSSYAAFLTLYAIAGPDKRNPANIFSSVALFGILSSALIVLPLSLAAVVDAVVGMGRVSNYLAAEEDVLQLYLNGPNTEVPDEKYAVTFSGACFEWEVFEEESEDEDAAKTLEQRKAIVKRKKEKLNAIKKAVKEQRKLIKQRRNAGDTSSVPLPPILQPVKKPADDQQTFHIGPINMEIKYGEFIVITGRIGSGKTSLLHAANGTMKFIAGAVKVGGELVTVGAPWIQNATIRDIILFGLPFDNEWYQQVVFSTCLQADFDMLPAKDLTEVGERGVTLSGGQKARLCLARAVYSKPTTFLLDDVLNAVDAKVGKHIMDHCIMGLLKGKTRVLTTHQLSLILTADRVLFMEDSGKASLGTIDELESTNTSFRALIDMNSGVEIEDDKILESEIPGQTKGPNTQEESGILITDEEKSVNAIGFKVVRQYIYTGVSGFKCHWIIGASVVITILHVFFELFTNTWLSFWIQYKFPRKSDGWYIALYTVFMVLSVVFNISGFAVIVYIMNRASHILNIEACRRIFYAPMWYMDVTPMGRIINRFTKDTDVLDNEMGDKTAMLSLFTAFLLGILILCIIFLPWFALAVPCIIFFFLATASFYQASGREIKRLEAIQRSKVYDNFNETLTGMETIKIYRKNDDFFAKNSFLINKMNEAYYLTTANKRWLDIAVSMLTSGFVLLIAFLCVYCVFKIEPESVGLILSYVLLAASLSSTLIVVFTEVEQDMNSAERILEYAHQLPQEAPYQITETKPPESWPDKGEIEFRDVCMSYRENLPSVLRNFTGSIAAKEKVGICGRTGAGKSSVMAALYRIAEISSGRICVDGLDISKLGLHDLRSKLSIIPQDSVLFDGTVRKNLDPFGEKTDDQLWSVLRRTNIIATEDIEVVKKQMPLDFNLHKFHLDRVVGKEGANFSLGERQLISFARALVRESKILVLDEATSSVDYVTDKKIQGAVVAEFGHCTILCIAHRLKTILNYDRIIVMDKGEIKEFDTPHRLFLQESSLFRQMCEKAGITDADFVRD